MADPTSIFGLTGGGLLLAAGIIAVLISAFGKFKGGRTLMNAGITLAVIGLLVQSNVLGNFGFGTTPSLPTSVAANTPGSAPLAAASTALSAACPTTLSTTAQCRVHDVMASTNTYLVADCYYIDGGSIFNITSTGTQPGFGGQVTLSCGKSYTPYALSTRGARNGGTGAQFTTSGDTKFVTIESSNASAIQVRVKDVSTDAFLNTSADSGAYSDLPRAFLNSTSGTQALVGTDGFLEQQVWFRTNTTRTRYGGAAAQCGVALDADVAAWQQPSYVRLDGVALQEAKSSLDADDQLGLAGLVNGTVEYFYPFPAGTAIDDSNHILTYRIQSASGTNPSTDLLWTFECKGWTLDSRNPLAVRAGYFANDAGRNESTMLNQVLRITVD